MNQFSDKNPNEVDRVQQVENPAIVLPTFGTQPPHEPNAEQLEAKIKQLVGEDAGTPIPTQPQPEPFDMLDYASLTNRQANSSTKQTLKDIDADLLKYAEKDPYVNPEELIANESTNKQTLETHMTENETQTDSMNFDPMELIDSADQTLEDINDFQQQLELLELHTAQQPQAQTTVEVIGLNPIESELANMKPEPAAISPPVLVDELPPTAWFADLATDIPGQEKTRLQRPAVPVMSQETGEPVFDVRDFCDSAEFVPEPIPGAYEVSPDLFDFKTVDEIDSKGESAPTNPNATVSSNVIAPLTRQHSDDQVFVAGTGDVIQINGADGFDHIDLACFDVNWATFSEQVIHVNDQQGSAFEIRYQDIGYAIFADGVEVRLDGQ